MPLRLISWVISHPRIQACREQGSRQHASGSRKRGSLPSWCVVYAVVQGSRVVEGGPREPVGRVRESPRARGSSKPCESLTRVRIVAEPRHDGDDGTSATALEEFVAGVGAHHGSASQRRRACIAAVYGD